MESDNPAHPQGWPCHHGYTRKTGLLSLHRQSPADIPEPVFAFFTIPGDELLSVLRDDNEILIFILA